MECSFYVPAWPQGIGVETIARDNDQLVEDLIQRFRSVRALTIDLCARLSDADATVQSMEDASPAKWHLAHTTWFWESFILRDHVPGYRAFDGGYAFLFNSYYEAEGDRHARPRRGMITRPSLDEVRDYRAHVDTRIEEAIPALPEAALPLIELGLNHEQQHQELLLTDIKHLFAQNPLCPAIWPCSDGGAAHANIRDITWIEGPSGISEIGHDGRGFGFDCEGPRHEVLLKPFALADRTVTNGEWLQFMEDGGYGEARHWLSDGWDWVREEKITSPLYWEQGPDGGWDVFGLDGLSPLDTAQPVSHISLFEADAYASWASAQWEGARLPTEAEWEVSAANVAPDSGHQLDEAGPIAPVATTGGKLSGMFGNVWEWTGSAYRPYPGFRPAPGAVGEYNGKFMSGQFVLKGGSCATPRGHCRASYRNFFYPHQRWQFSGVRLARDI